MESLVLIYLLVRLSVTLCDRPDPAVIRATASIAQKNCVSFTPFDYVFIKWFFTTDTNGFDPQHIGDKGLNKAEIYVFFFSKYKYK